jgi:hypothetical protein
LLVGMFMSILASTVVSMPCRGSSPTSRAANRSTPGSSRPNCSP